MPTDGIFTTDDPSKDDKHTRSRGKNKNERQVLEEEEEEEEEEVVGTIQVKNWKPLSFEELTDDPDVEVENLLKDISNHLTLRIITKQSDHAVSDCLRDMKDRLLQTIWQKLPQIGNDIHLPQLKGLVTNLVQGDGPPAVDAQLMHLFNVWLEQLSKTKMSSGLQSQWPSSSTSQSNGDNGSTGVGKSGIGHCSSRFNPTLEIPKLERWFRETPNPTRQKLLQYMTLMNNSSYRKHSSKITYQQICNWFINARATMRNRSWPNRRFDGQPTRGGQEPMEQGDSWPLSSGGSSRTVTGGRRQPSAAAAAAAAAAAGASSSSTSSSTLTLNSSTGAGCCGVGSPPSISANSLGAVAEISSSVAPVLADLDLDSAGDVGVATAGGSASSPQAQQAGSDHSNGQSPSASSRTSGDMSVNVKDDPDADQQALYFGQTLAGCQSAGDIGSPTLLATGATENGGTPAGSCSGGSASTTSPLFNISANRTRLMFDPLTELPMLERWFEENPHPSWVQVDQFTEMLNVMPYRQTYPPVSSHNVKIWFKNRRAKFKRNLVGTIKVVDSGTNANATPASVSGKGEQAAQAANN